MSIVKYKKNVSSNLDAEPCIHVYIEFQLYQDHYEPLNFSVYCVIYVSIEAYI